MHYPRTIGVDFDLRFLRVGEDWRTKRSAGADLEALRLPPDASESQRMIARYVEENGLTGLPAVLGVPAENVFLNILTLPSGTRQARNAAVREHLEGLRALSGSETVSDVFPLAMRGGRRRMLLGVARRDAVNALIDPLLIAGMKIVATIPVSLAFFNRALAQVPRRRALVVLCPVSETGVEVLAGADRTLCGVWRLPLNLLDQPEGEDALQAFARELADLLPRQVGDDFAVPDVVWCGEAPLPEPLAERLERAIGARPVPLEPWLSEPGRATRRPALASALPQCAPGSAGLRLNLLPSPMRERIARLARLPYGLAAALLFAAFSASLAFQAFQRDETARHRLETAQSQWREMQALQAVEAEVQARNAVLSQQAAALRYSAMSPRLMRDLLIAIAEAKHPDDWIVRIADAESYFAASDSPVAGKLVDLAAAPFSFSPHVIIVEGYTLGADLSSVRTLIETLRQHPRFIAVDLLGDDRVAPDRAQRLLQLIPRIHRFVMEIRIREP